MTNSTGRNCTSWSASIIFTPVRSSNQARTLLDDWNRSLDDFVKVIPIEYKHVLEQERLRALAEKVQNLQIQY